MFEHLRIELPPIIPSTDLTGFGRINLICGKNNSGKSSLLKAIEQKDYRKIGITLDDEDISSVITAVQPRTSSNVLNALHELLTKMAVSRKLWIVDDHRTFTQEFLKLKQQNLYLRSYSMPSDRILNAFNNLFDTYNHEPVLISPQRRLQTSTGINLRENVMANGKGLLNYLFRARTQPDDTEDYKVFRSIREAFTKISSGYIFDIFTEPPPANAVNAPNNVELKFARSGKGWVKADSCGLGLQDLIIILYFAIHPNYRIILIEEPETHLHPEMQKKLLYFMREETEKQFFMSTHSNVFLNSALTDKVLFTTFDKEIVIDDATSRAVILDELGYSVADNLVSDLVILLEGPKDVAVIEEFLVKLGLFAKYEIKMWPLGGDIMGQVDLSVFAEKYRIVALVDRDPGSERTRKRFVKKCEELNIPVTRLKRYAIENYFPVSALRAVFKGQIPEGFTEVKEDESLEKQLGMNVKNNNRQLAEHTSIEDIANTDLHKFLLKVGQLCSKT